MNPDETTPDDVDLTAPEEGYTYLDLFIESLVPAAEDPADEEFAVASTIRAWLVAELDAAIDVLAEEHPTLERLEGLKYDEPSPKTGPLPGLVFVHLERRVRWATGDDGGEGFDFEIEDAIDDDPEDELGWEELVRAAEASPLDEE